MADKKRLIIIISISAVLIVLIGISAFWFFTGKLSGTNKESLASDGTDNLSAPSLPEVTLTFALRGFESQDSRAVLDEVEKKAKKELNVKLNFKWSNLKGDVESFVWNDPNNQFDAYCLLDYTEIGGYVRSALQSGFIIDIKDLFPKYAPNYYKNFTPEELNALTYDGKLGAVPCNLPLSSEECAFVREDLMKKYNIPEIKNINDYEVFLNTIKQNESEITPMYLNAYDAPPFSYVYDTALKLFGDSYGYVPLDTGLRIVYKRDDPGMKLMAWEQTPEFSEAVGRMKKWRDSGYCNDASNYFDKSRFASFISTKFQVLVTQRPTDSSSSYADLKFKAYPLFPGVIFQSANFFNGGIAISSKSKNPERVLMFIDWLQSSQENYDLLMYGIKGRNYVLYGDQFDLPKGANSDDSAYTSWSGRGAFINMNNERTSIINAPDFKKNYLHDILSRSKVVPHAGFIEDSKPVEKMAAVRLSGYCAVEEAIRTTNFTDKTIDDFISENKKNGVDNLINTIQKQLDEWKTTNKK